MGESFSKGANRQALLQRELGEIGQVLPRVPRGGEKYPAAGWYARLADGKTRYLGDHSIIAAQTIGRLKEQVGEEAPA